MNRPERTDENGLIFTRHSAAREAALLLVRDKNGRYSLLREPLYLDRCVIAADPAWQSYFEVQELLGKDTFIFKVCQVIRIQGHAESNFSEWTLFISRGHFLVHDNWANLIMILSLDIRHSFINKLFIHYY